MTNSIFEHRSVRKYKDAIILPEILNKILLAATRASNTGNMQPYSLVVTTKPELKEQLWEAHFKQEMIKKAPVIITFCADFNRFSKWCLQNKANPGFENFLSFYTGSIDAILASQNAALQAENEGLGICYLGTTTYMAKRIIEILNLPKGVVPVTSIVIGYPEETPELTDRLPLEGVIHYETYHDYSEEDINSIYEEKDNSDFTKELLKINNKESLAQIFTDNRYTKKDNILFSNNFLKVIEEQGFMGTE